MTGAPAGPTGGVVVDVVVVRRRARSRRRVGRRRGGPRGSVRPRRGVPARRDCERGGGDHHEDRGGDDGDDQPAVGAPAGGHRRLPLVRRVPGWWLSRRDRRGHGPSGAGGSSRGGSGGRPPWASLARRTALSIAPRARRLGVPGGVSAACPSVIASSSSHTARVGAVANPRPPGQRCSATGRAEHERSVMADRKIATLSRRQRCEPTSCPRPAGRRSRRGLTGVATRRAGTTAVPPPRSRHCSATTSAALRPCASSSGTAPGSARPTGPCCRSGLRTPCAGCCGHRGSWAWPEPSSSATWDSRETSSRCWGCCTRPPPDIVAPAPS